VSKLRRITHTPGGIFWLSPVLWRYFGRSFIEIWRSRKTPESRVQYEAEVQQRRRSYPSAAGER
jgi:hypothetical protein